MQTPSWPADLDKTPLCAEGGEASAHALRRPFLLAGSRVGVLVVHGFSGTPFEVRPLAEALWRRGYTVYGPRLAGHAESSAALGASTYTDWRRSVDEAFQLLSGEVDRICVCGLSLGGLLTLDLARQRGPEIAAIQVLAAPLWLSASAELAIAITRRLRRRPRFTLPKLSGSDIADPIMRKRNNLSQGAIGLPIPAVMSLRDFMDQVRAELPRVSVPAFLAHSKLDHTAPYACMAALASELGSTSVETLTLERSYHVLPLDLERAALADAVAAHIARHA